MLVTDRHALGRRQDLVRIAGAAVAGGADAVQVREKDLCHDEMTSLAERIQRVVGDRAAVLVNGSPEAATSVGVGLHLPGDSPTPADREWPLWGRSVHSPEEARRRADESPHYLLVGPVYPTDSKPEHPGGGLGLIEATVRAADPVPVLAIGGIDAGNAGAVIDSGAAGIAVRGAILTAHNPERTAHAIRAAAFGVRTDAD